MTTTTMKTEIIKAIEELEKEQDRKKEVLLNLADNLMHYSVENIVINWSNRLDDEEALALDNFLDNEEIADGREMAYNAIQQKLYDIGLTIKMMFDN